MCNLAALPGKHRRSFHSLQQLERRVESLERNEQQDSSIVKGAAAAAAQPTQAKPRLTACHFGQALGLWKGQRYRLWQQKSGIVNGYSGEIFDRLNADPDAPGFLAAAKASRAPRPCRQAAMMWGLGNEVEAINRYSKITGSIVDRETRFAIYNESDELYNWIGAWPDALVEEEEESKNNEEQIGDRKDIVQAKNCSGGILEVKCPHLPPSSLTLPYFYVPQAQGLMEILDREWLDFYIWTPEASRVLRIEREQDYWGLIFRVMSEFWWGNVLPARREAFLGDRGNPDAFMPRDTHPLTLAVIRRSHEIAARARVVWTDFA